VKLRDPALNGDYLKWLQSTPWTVSHSLPLGNLSLDLRDVIFAGLMAIAVLPTTWRMGLWPATAFLVAHHLALSLFTLRSTARWSAYVLGAGSALALWAWNLSPIAAFVLAGLLAVPAWLGIRQHLRRLPFASLGNGDAGSKTGPAKVSWPYDLVHQRDSLWGAKGADRVCLPLLLGWFALLATSLFTATGTDGADAVAMICFFLPLVAGTARLVTYIAGVNPANGLLARWATRRPIDPAYDQVFVVPLLLVLLSPTSIVALDRAGSYLPFVSAALITAAGMLTLLGGPSISRWRLTCPARLSPISADGRQMERI
jgi:hypothetical protein